MRELFLGNGVIGMMAYVASTDNFVTFWIGRPDVTDHRKAPDRKISMGIKGASVVTDYCRLDVGKFKLYPDSEILSGTMSLDIYNGEIIGRIQTASGVLALRTYTPRIYNVNIVEVEYGAKLEGRYVSGVPFSPRFLVFPEQKQKNGYVDNPQPVCETTSEGGGCVYPLNAGGDYAVCWQRKTNGSRSVFYVAAANETPQMNASLGKAQAEMGAVERKDLLAVRLEMNEWWHKYWEVSMINIPDKELENLYNIQMYKLAVNSAPEGPAMDCLGVLYKTTQ